MGIEFSKLAYLRLRCRQIIEDQIDSLNYFALGVGYQHYKGKTQVSISASSSATCVLSLVATNSWKADKAKTKELLSALIQKKTSAGLPDDNPYTVAWTLEALTALEPYSDPLAPADQLRATQIEGILEKALQYGAVRIDEYPPTAYLTQLVTRALDRRGKLGHQAKDAVRKWALAELPRQINLVQANSKTADPFAVAYLAILVAGSTPRDETNPELTSIQRVALRTFFDSQRKDGTWPLSRPLFHYKNFGNAYCYEYEMLTQLLSERKLQDLLLEYLPNLSAAVESVLESAYSVQEGVQAWTSGHHPQIEFPESWATASVYHFIYVLDRLLAEAVRQQLFRYLDLPFPEPPPIEYRAVFAKDFLDSTVKVKGKVRSLKDFLWTEFVSPLSKEADSIAKGEKFKKGTPLSAIFFGPPGTSKTELSKQIADFLGWPLLSIDPSHLLRNGMDGIQAEANAIFRMLEETERVVVLFDEFDEFVRERGSSDAEQFSRLLTTAMLPKLVGIRKRRTLIFIIATNNIQQFDLAIQRPGRFDRLVQIMPPTYKAKLTKKNWGAEENVDIEQRLRSFGLDKDAKIKQQLGDLTYLECDGFATQLEPITSAVHASRALADRWTDCILQTPTQNKNGDGPEITWKKRCEDEEHFVR
jgi:hypothetical protein